MRGPNSFADTWPTDLHRQGEHVRRTFGSCPVEMLEANVDSPDRTPASYRGAHAECSATCRQLGRCARAR